MAKTDSPGVAKLDPIGRVGTNAYVLWSEVVGVQGSGQCVTTGSGIAYYTRIVLRGGDCVTTDNHSSKDERDRELEKLLAEWRRYLSESA